MRIQLEGKTAIVTGSTKGIGLATAKALAAAGAKVVINGRTRDAVRAAEQAVAEAVHGACLDGVEADLSTAQGCQALVAAQPVCDILVNNVGVFGPQDFFDIPDEEWSRFFETNVLSGVRLARAYATGMAERRWGRIVFLGSESAFNIPADMIHYGMTKTACVSVARGLAKRLAGTGVTVNSVLPGPTLSDGVRAMMAEAFEDSGQTIAEQGAEFVMQQRPTSIIQRAATVDEVANMIVYTCSPQASATTGAAMRVDGGIVDSL